MRISELKRAIREMIVGELNEAEIGQVTTDDSIKAAELAKKGVNVELTEDDALMEMANIVGDLQVAIEKAIAQNKDAEMKDLRKAIRTDDDVISALKDLEKQDKNFDLAGNQLDRFIKKTKGELIPQPRGRKADPNKPAKEPKEPKEKEAKDSKKSDDTLAYTMGGDVKISGKTPTKSLIRKAVKSAALNKPVELLKIKDMAVIDKEIVDLSDELKSKVATAKEIATKGNIKSYTEEEATFMDDIRAKGQRLAQLKATKEKLLTKTIKRQDRNIDIASTDED
jgi:hypothetical protein